MNLKSLNLNTECEDPLKIHTMSFNPYEVLASIRRNNPDNPAEMDQRDKQRKMIYWFKKHVVLLSHLSDSDLTTIMKTSELKRYKPERLVLKQGEEINHVIIVLNGRVSLYKTDVNFTELESTQPNLPYINPKKNHRHQLGLHVGSHGEGFTIGEVCLTRDESWSIGSLITDEMSGILFVPRKTYVLILKQHVQQEILEKSNFYDNCGHFNNYPVEKSSQLKMSLKKYIYNFGNVIHEQNSEVTDLMFVANGEVKIVLTTKKPTVDSTEVLFNNTSAPFVKNDKKLDEDVNSLRKSWKVEIVLLKQNEALGLTEYLTNNFIHSVSAICNVNNTKLYGLSVNQFAEFIPTGSEIMKEFLWSTISRLQQMIPMHTHTISREYFKNQLVDLTRISSKVRFKEIFETNEKSESDKSTVKKGDRTSNDFYKEFIPEHGLLIDQAGPGTVFEWLRMKEKKLELRKFKEQQRLDIDNGSKITLKVITKSNK